MTMDYGLTPAEQAAQRATQRAGDTRRRRTVSTYKGMTGTDPGDFGGTPNNLFKAAPPIRTAPMTGPAPRDWQTGMSGLPAFEPKVPLDLSRAGQKQTLGRSPVPPMQQEINPLQLPYGAVRAQAAPTRPDFMPPPRIDDVFDAARKGYQFVPPNPNPTTGYSLQGEINPMGSNFMLTDSPFQGSVQRATDLLPPLPYTPRGPMTGPNDRRDLLPQFHNYMLSPSWAGGAFEPNIPWDHTQPYPTPSRIGPAVVPPRGFTGQIERGYGGYPQMQQEINPLQVPPRLSNALQTLKKLGMGGPMPPTTPPIYSPTQLPPMRQIVEGF